MRFFKEPLVQFLLIGACIYGAYALFGAPEDGANDDTIIISEARINGLAMAWQKRWNRPPTDEELAGIVREYVREEILYREALAIGLDKDDHIVRRRMAQKLEFLTSDIAQMREPTDAELEQYMQDNLERFRDPDRVTFTHVYFDPDKRDDTTLTDAEEALVRLQAAGEPLGDIVDEGDRFMLPSQFRQASDLDIRRQMGSGFAASVLQLEPGQWHGPVLSGYGTHLVYVHEFIEASPPVLADIRQAVINEWQSEQTNTFNADYIDALRSRYDIVIEGPVPADALAPTDTAEDLATGDNSGAAS